MDKNKYVRISISMTPDLRQDIKVYAAECGITIAELAKDLIVKELIKSGFYDENGKRKY